MGKLEGKCKAPLLRCRLGFHRYQIMEIIKVWMMNLCFWGCCCDCGEEGVVWD
jgi:hypothetical protein